MIAACVLFFVMPDNSLCKTMKGNNFTDCFRYEGSEKQILARTYVSPVYYDNVKVCKDDPKEKNK